MIGIAVGTLILIILARFFSFSISPNYVFPDGESNPGRGGESAES